MEEAEVGKKVGGPKKKTRESQGGWGEEKKERKSKLARRGVERKV
jgi:hypothetical protein